MAGAGFRSFAVGEVLTAANVNTFLMQQAVMVFDDAADRTADLPTPSEGMLSYLKDSDLLFKYNGTGWVDAAPGILVGYIRSSSTSGSIGTTSFNSVSVTYTPKNASNLLVIEITGGAYASTDEITPQTLRRVQFELHNVTSTTLLATAIMSFGFPTANDTSGTILTHAPLLRFIEAAGSTSSRQYRLTVNSTANMSYGLLGDPPTIISVTEIAA